jgi:hypothetical protein
MGRVEIVQRFYSRPIIRYNDRQKNYFPRAGSGAPPVLIQWAIVVIADP